LEGHHTHYTYHGSATGSDCDSARIDTYQGLCFEGIEYKVGESRNREEAFLRDLPYHIRSLEQCRNAIVKRAPVCKAIWDVRKYQLPSRTIIHRTTLISLQGRYGPYNKYKDAEDQFHAARTMLSYFHYVCQGSVPLSISEKHLIGELEPDQVDYVIQLRNKLRKKGMFFISL
jgi:hypothetical protein